MDNDNLVEKGEGLLVAEAMGDNYPTICIDSYVDSKDGGFKVRTVTIYDDVVVEVLRTLCQLDSIIDKKYKDVIDSPEYELCEYNQKTKKDVFSS